MVPLWMRFLMASTDTPRALAASCTVASFLDSRLVPSSPRPVLFWSVSETSSSTLSRPLLATSCRILDTIAALLGGRQGECHRPQHLVGVAICGGTAFCDAQG